MDEFFCIETTDRHLRHQVTDIRVVLPDEAEPLDKVEDKGLATPITCTPYGVSTHCLLVMSERVPTDDGDAQVEAEQVHPRVLQSWMTTVLASVVIILYVAGWI